MCGFYFSNQPVNNEKINFIMNELKLRGPDAQNVLRIGNNHALHARLSITGDDVSGKQPGSTSRFILLFNGQIYNYQQLASEYGFALNAGTSDTEILLRLIEKHFESGELDCHFLKALDGFYSILVYDVLKDQIYLARDPSGKKPIYLRVDGGHVQVASRATVLLDNSFSLNKSKISRFINHGEGLIDREHWFADVEVLEPGRFMKLAGDGKAKKISKFEFQPSFKCKTTSEFIAKAIKKRVKTEKSLAVAVSSGVDSTTIASFLQKLGIKCDFASVGFEPMMMSEIPKLCEKMDIKTEDINPIMLSEDTEEISASFSAAIEALEVGHSSTAIIAYYQLCRTVHERGYKVLIEGQGADELFLGYDKYLLWMAMQQLRLFRVVKAFRYLHAYYSLHQLKKTIIELVRFLFPSLRRLQGLRWKSWKIISDHYRQNLSLDVCLPVFNQLKFRRLELTNNLVNLLHYGDAIPLRHGIENRNPFCDLELRQYVLQNLTADDLLVGGITKYPVRKFSRTHCDLDQPMEQKIGFFTNVVKTLRVSNEFNPKELHSFLMEKNILVAECQEKDLEKIPDNIFFRLCGIKAALHGLEKKGFFLKL